MSLVKIAESFPPYAYLSSNNGGGVILGLVDGVGPQVDMDRARAESVAAYVHNAFQLTISHMEKGALKFVASEKQGLAVATLVSNKHLPDRLQHNHVGLKNMILFDAALKSDEEQLAQTKEAIKWTALTLLANPGIYGEDKSTVFKLALAHFNTMLDLGGLDYSADAFLINDQGKLRQK